VIGRFAPDQGRRCFASPYGTAALPRRLTGRFAYGAGAARPYGNNNYNYHDHSNYNYHDHSNYFTLSTSSASPASPVL
jgi:hypothetical protein